MQVPVASLAGVNTFGAFSTGGFKPQATTASGDKIGGVNITGAVQRTQAKLNELAAIIKGNAELDALLTKGPDGTWIPNIGQAQPSAVAPVAGAQFFNRVPAPETVTNAPVALPVMNDAAVKYLLQNPGTRDAFDLKYGPGSAMKILGR